MIPSPDQLKAQRPRYRWTVMGLYWAANCVAAFAIFSFLMSLPAIREELGLTVQQVGWLASLPWLSMAIFALPFSAIFSRFGPRRILTVTLALAALLAFGQAFATSFEVLFVTRLGLAIIVVARLPAATLLTQQWFENDEVTRVNGANFGLNNLIQGLSLGITPLLLVLLGGWRQPVALSGVLLLLLLVLWVIWGRERNAPASGQQLAQSGSSLFVFRRFPSLLLIATCQVGPAVGYGAFLSFWPSYAVEVLGISLTVAGALVMLWPIGSLVGSFAAETIAHRIGSRKRAIVLTGFIQPFVFFTLVQVRHEALAGLLLFAAGFCALVIVPLIFSLPFAYPGIRPDEIAVASGAIYSLSTVGAAVGPVLVANIQVATGSLGTGLAVASVFAIGLGLMGLGLPDFDHPKRGIVPRT